MASSFSLSPFSSSLLPSPLLLQLRNNKLLTAFVSIQPSSSSTTLIHCASTSTTTSSSPYTKSADKKRHWKVGEYPGTSDSSSSNSTRRFGNGNGSGNRNQNGNRIGYGSRSGNGNGSGNRNQNGNRIGYGSGSGSGSGNRNGNGSGNRNQNGNRIGYGSGSGNGNGSRNRNQNGNRIGYGSGSGNRNGNGNGSGNRNRNGNRSGSGSGSGNGSGNGNGRSNTVVRTPNKNIKKKLENEAKAGANTVTESLSHLIQTKQWLQALEVFEMLKEQPFYQPREGTYMKLIVLLGKSGQPQHAHQLFDTMLEEGLEPTLELYTALLAAYCRSNLIEEAFSILDKMKTLPLCQPDVYTYSILIKACVDASRFKLVESLYEQMAEQSIAPNTVTQNIVLSGYGKAGKLEQMEKVLSVMLESTTCKPDVWTMNNIVSLFGNKGQIDMMERWYEKFRDFGIEPETRTFNILIGAYGKKRMYDKMSSVMEYMRKLSFPWTTSTYNNVIEAFSESGDAKHMEYTFDQMRAERMKTDTKTFCCLIRGYANAGLFHKVISTVQLAGKLEIPENTSFYNAVIFACAKLEDLMEMERVFKGMKDKQCPPNSTTYSMMVDAYKREGMSDKVYDLEQEQQLMGLSGPKDDEAMGTLLDV